MKAPVLFSMKQGLGSRLFVIAIIVSIVIPQTYALSLPIAFAEEGTESSSVSENESKNEEAREEKADNSESKDKPEADAPAISVSDDSATKDNKRSSVDQTSNTTPLNRDNSDISNSPATPVDNDTPSDISPKNETKKTRSSSNSGGGASSDSAAIQDPQIAEAGQTGSITVCNVIAKENGQIVTSSAGMPNGSFFMNLRERIGNSSPIQTTAPIQEISFRAHNFSQTVPSPISLSAQCSKYSNLELKQYIYSEVTVVSQIHNRWEKPKYNDQFTDPVNTLENFYAYDLTMFDADVSNDGQRNENADGIVTLTANRPDRVVVILNKLKPFTPATSGTIIVCKIIQDNTGAIIGMGSHLLPPATFSVMVTPGTSPPSLVRTATWDSLNYMTVWPSPGADPTSPMSALDADCQTFENLPFDPLGYIYREEVITGSGAGYYVTPRYNDGATQPPSKFTNFHTYSLGLEVSNPNSDGHVMLTPENPVAKIFVLNQYTAYTPPCENGTELSVTEFRAAVNLGRITYAPIFINADGTKAILTFYNDTGCTAPISFSSYKMFDPLPTLSTQVLYDRVGIVQATTTTVLTINIPNCAAQIDSWYGLAPEQLLDTNPYVYPAVPHVLNHALTRQDQLCSETNPVNTPPSITLVGSNPMSVTENTTFTDPGATAFDTEDGNLTSSIVVTGTVNTNVVGAYVLTYSVTDSGGLSASTTRTVNVTEGGGSGPTNNPPTITILGDNPMTVYINTTFTDPGATATDQEDGDLTSQIVTTGAVDTSVLGSYPITYSATDSGGLSASTTRTVNVLENPGNNDNDDNDDNNGGGSRRNGQRRSSGGGGEILGAETGPTACFYLRDYLRRDFNNDQAEVLKLQFFLKYFEGENNLSATGSFDQATFDAVSRFQTKYLPEILTPWGHTAPTGYVYILTKKKVNEIFCQTAFPINSQQQEEIDNFRALIQGLKDRGITIPTGGSVMIEGDSTIKIDNMVGLGTSTSPVGSIGQIVKDKIDTKNLKAVAAAIFSIPQDREAILQGIYFLLIALIAIYLFTEIIVGSRDSSGLTKYQVWSRKATGYLIGLIVAIIASVWYQVFGIVVPLLVLAIASGVFLAWTLTRKTDGEAINLPPSNQ